MGDGIAAYSLQQYEKAYEIWSALAREGNAEAEYRLAGLYELGHAVEPDMARAAELYRRAGGHGHAGAAFEYARILASGRGVAEDDEGAVRFARMAAGAGHGRAMYFLATLLALGEGTGQDMVGAAYWLSKAEGALMTPAGKARASDLLGNIMDRLTDAQKETLRERLRADTGTGDQD